MFNTLRKLINRWLGAETVPAADLHGSTQTARARSSSTLPMEADSPPQAALSPLEYRDTALGELQTSNLNQARQHFEKTVNFGTLGNNNDNSVPPFDFRINQQRSFSRQETEAEIKTRKSEKNFAFVLKKENRRLRNIIENMHLITGLKKPLENKIFCIGSNKTGTTSLDSSMRTLGFTSMPEDLAYQYLALGQNDQIQNEIFRTLLKKECAQFNFFEDLPFCYRENYKAIDEFFPDAKFILSIRNPEEWFSSCIRWIENLDCKSIYNWIWGINFASENKEEIINLYKKRNIEVQDYFADTPSKLLVSYTEQASFSNLCNFLGIEVSLAADLVYPKENVNDFNH